MIVKIKHVIKNGFEFVKTKFGFITIVLGK